MDDKASDAIFDALESRRRRIIIVCLADCTPPLTVQELSLQVAEREVDFAVKEVSQETEELVLRTLHHIHLPKLSDLNVIQYDAAQNEVEPGEMFEMTVTVLREIECLECGSMDLTQIDRSEGI